MEGGFFRARQNFSYRGMTASMNSSRVKPERLLQASEMSRSTMIFNRARCFGSEVSRSHRALSKRSSSGLREDLLKDSIGSLLAHPRPVPHAQLVLKHKLGRMDHLSGLHVVEFGIGGDEGA